MLPPDYFTNKEDRLLYLYRQLEDFILKDSTRRLLSAGEMTSTADRLIYKLRMMGESREEIQKKLMELTGLAREELRKLLQDAVLTSWEDDASDLKELGIELSNPLENPDVIRVMDAEYKKSLGELTNLTRTTMEQSQTDLINMLDEADLRVSSGIQSYSAAVCDILDRYAGKGIEVLYPTGTKRTLEAAVRCCVVTSMNQTAAQVTNQYIVEAESEYVLVSAHLGARVQREGQPYLAGHDNWQGKVYRIVGSEPKYLNLLECTGYDIDPGTGIGKVVDPLGLHGYNCRHSHKPWDIRLRNPYIDENGNLKIDSEENRKQYELQQKQRAMERAIRKTKRKFVVKRQEIDSVAETDVKSILQKDYSKLAAKLTKQNQAYNDFCKDNNLQPQYDRTKTADFARKQEKAVKEVAKRFLKEQDSSDTELESTNTATSMNDTARNYMRFTGSNTIFENKTPIEKCNIAKELTEKYVNRESKWKGTVKVDDERCKETGIAGRKDWSCTILVHSNTQARTYIHEMLHSRSASHTNPLTYRMHRKIEEASTELLARQICINENITFMYSYRKEVYALHRINNIVKIEENDLLFARKLYDKDLQVRFTWLKNRCDRYLRDHPNRKAEVESLLKELKGL